MNETICKTCETVFALSPHALLIVSVVYNSILAVRAALRDNISESATRLFYVTVAVALGQILSLVD